MAKKEYIEREEIMQYLKDRYDWYARMIKEAVHWNEAKAYRVLQLLAVDMFEYFRDRAPAADVAPVVHEEWEWHTEVYGNPIDGMDEDFGYRCSNCKAWAEEYGVDGDIYEEPPTRLNYCPNCGAKMDGVKRVYEI